MRNASAICILLLIVTSPVVANAADFIWRGELMDEGQPANGSYDLSVELYADQAAKTEPTGVIELDSVSVNDGKFAVTLPLDDLNSEDRLWLEIGVRDAGSNALFEKLAQRQPVDLHPAAACPAAWEITGNAGLGAGNFLGTTDETNLEIRAGNRASLRIFPLLDNTFGDTPNVILGSSGNQLASPTVIGGTISGGGGTTFGQGLPCPSCGNQVADFATVGGGLSNSAGFYGAVGGGKFNHAPGDTSTVAGGESNYAVGLWSTVPGGEGNQAGGVGSLAAGVGATVRDPGQSGDADGDEGTFIWSDHLGPSFTSTGKNQFLVRASGGFGLNTPPIDRDVEMTIQANEYGADFPNLFLQQKNSDGIMLSAGQGTGANSAQFLIDQFNGTAQTRRLTLAGNGDLTVTAAAFKPGGGSWSASSDVRLKTGIRPLARALDRLLALKGVSFEYAKPNSDLRPEGRYMGFIAQQVAALFPNWIGHDPAGYLTVGTQGFEALTVEAVRELKARNDRLAEQNAELRAGQQRLMASLNELRAELSQSQSADTGGR